MLVALGVGHPKVDQICTLLARYGIHPKMTGAGGGGSVFAFLKPGMFLFVFSSSFCSFKPLFRYPIDDY